MGRGQRLQRQRRKTLVDSSKAHLQPRRRANRVIDVADLKNFREVFAARLRFVETIGSRDDNARSGPGAIGFQTRRSAEDASIDQFDRRCRRCKKVVSSACGARAHGVEVEKIERLGTLCEPWIIRRSDDSLYDGDHVALGCDGEYVVSLVAEGQVGR